MGDILDANELFGKFKNTLELKTYAKDIFLRLQVAVKKLEEQEKEIAHLKTLLSANSSNFEIIPPEQLTCEMEIRKLEAASKSRNLTLEEAKIFDIMTKNLLAIKKAKQEEKRPIKDVEEDETVLLGIISEPADKNPSSK